MDKEIKEKWLEALSSGKYEKGYEALRCTDDKFCCLGVLCDLIDNKKWKLETDLIYTYNSSSALLPKNIKELTNISTKDMCELVFINDRNKTFKEVIEYINQEM